MEAFVLALSGKGLSVREVEQLAHGFFRGPESFREEIRKGNLALPLARMRQIPYIQSAGSPSRSAGCRVQAIPILQWIM